jgi:tRNA threonylcarbamoyl adenosine modification protein YjeE
MRRVTTGDAAATETLGRRLGTALRPGDVVFLEAPLGTGKTVLARGMIRAATGAEVEVTSPSFALIQPYDGRVAVVHADLYRIDDPSDVRELGLEDVETDAALLVEWPELGEGFLPPVTLRIVGVTGPSGAREWRISGTGHWQDVLDRWETE